MEWNESQAFFVLYILFSTQTRITRLPIVQQKNNHATMKLNDPAAADAWGKFPDVQVCLSSIFKQSCYLHYFYRLRHPTKDDRISYYSILHIYIYLSRFNWLGSELRKKCDPRDRHAVTKVTRYDLQLVLWCLLIFFLFSASPLRIELATKKLFLSRRIHARIIIFL